MSPLVVPGVVLGGLVLVAATLPSPTAAGQEAEALAAIDGWIAGWSPTVGTTIWNGITWVPRQIAGAVEGAFGDLLVSMLTNPYVLIGLGIGGYLVLRHADLIGKLLVVA